MSLWYSEVQCIFVNKKKTLHFMLSEVKREPGRQKGLIWRKLAPKKGLFFTSFAMITEKGGWCRDKLQIQTVAVITYSKTSSPRLLDSVRKIRGRKWCDELPALVRIFELRKYELLTVDFSPLGRRISYWTAQYEIQGGRHLHGPALYMFLNLVIWMSDWM